MMAPVEALKFRPEGSVGLTPKLYPDNPGVPPAAVTGAKSVAATPTVSDLFATASVVESAGFTVRTAALLVAFGKVPLLATTS